MTARVLRVSCPVCGAGAVSLGSSSWLEGQEVRRSVWADEPLSCSGSCLLPSDAVRRLVVTVYRTGAAQLPLDLKEVAA